MKRILSSGIIALSLLYYAATPFFVAHAGESPVSTVASKNGLEMDSVASILYMRVTAYASVPDETDDTPFITANGSHVHDGIVASNILPFGTKIMIPLVFGDKIFTVEDRMSQRIKNTIDIWMASKQQAMIFGMTHAAIVVLGNESSTPTVAIQ